MEDKITEKQMDYISYLFATISIPKRSIFKSKLVEVKEPWGLKGAERNITLLLFEEWVALLSKSEAGELIDMLIGEKEYEFQDFLNSHGYYSFVRSEEVSIHGIVDEETDAAYLTRPIINKTPLPF